MILCPSIVSPNLSASAEGEAGAEVEVVEETESGPSEEEEIEAVEKAIASGEFKPEGSFSKMHVADEPAIGEQAQIPQSLKCPGTPTALQLEVHSLTHLPYRAWCPHCATTRKSTCGTLHFQNGQNLASPDGGLLLSP